MVTVYQHGVNSITLSGSCLEESNSQRSSIALHPSGWAVALNFNREVRMGLHRSSGLTRKQIIPSLRQMLNNCWQMDEEIDDVEINKYLDIIERDFGFNGKHPIPRRLFLLCSDLATALVGPFKDMGEIADHLKFLQERGDACVIHHCPQILTDAGSVHFDIQVTPEQDRNQVLTTA